MTDNMRSRVLGMIASLVSRGQFPKPTAEPVAFLYGHVAKEGETPTHSINGVDYVGWIGPKLPVVEGRPYKIVGRTIWGDQYAVLSAEPFRTTDDPPALSVAGLHYQVADNQWEFFRDNTGASEESGTMLLAQWANTDLYSTDGTLYLAASDPVPVYE